MTDLKPLVLLVEDETQMRTFVRLALTSHGHRVLEVETGQEALQQAAAHTPDLVLLDLGLPDIDGLEVTKRLREWSATPIVVISARGQERQKVEALDAGADDYVTKPFGSAELMARIRVALRHAARTAIDPLSSVVTIGALRIDLAKRQILAGETEVHLTPIEYKLLVVLTKHAGMVLTHKQLLDQVWGPGHAHQMQYLRVYMAQLRQKLEENPARPRYLLTEPGVGSRLKSEAYGRSRVARPRALSAPLDPLWARDAGRGMSQAVLPCTGGEFDNAPRMRRLRRPRGSATNRRARCDGAPLPSSSCLRSGLPLRPALRARRCRAAEPRPPPRRRAPRRAPRLHLRRRSPCPS